MTSCIDRIKNRGKLRIAVSVDYQPGKIYWTPQTNILEGFEADLGRLFAEELLGNGNQIEFIKVMFSERVNCLVERQVDLVISIFKIMKERLDQILFSKPYFIDKLSLLTIKEGSIKHLSDLKRKKVAIADKTFIFENFKKDFPEAEIVLAQDIPEGIRSLESSSVEAFACLYTTAMTVKTNWSGGGQFAILDTGNQFSAKDYAVGINKDCRDLYDFINTCLHKFEAKAILQDLLKKHNIYPHK